ncbi:hypothetical protein KDU71_22605 [Carboxylicivirga sediminis]|uniref:Uncharacterized protein n=1 Tax=Carboxylicivirga sediminis TaxID=2006564 RepID=A0A941J070_9BACT|nr:hypothetical protein [Carboxylicivirga sediminis]MBR8538380.1 hypothetical protein [Carboxylicivirga sediminis]
MKALFALLFLTLLACQLFGQSEVYYNSDYSPGIYKTKSEFINNTPSITAAENLRIEKIELIGQSDSLIRRCKFYHKDTDKKIKKVFAISFQNKLYFSTGAILKNKNKKDKSLSANSNNEFVLVLLGGSNFLYSEAGLINHWKVGLSSGVSSGVGGITGHALGEAIEDAYPTTTVYGKGVVWDYKNNEFNVFTDCKDFNEFIYPFKLETLNCNVPEINLNEIRERISKIK